MDCERHPGQEAVGKCLECGKGICPQCVTETNQVLVCPECFQKRTDEIAAGMGTVGGKAPKARKEKPTKVGKPKKEELPAAVEAPPAVVPQQAASLIDVIPAAEQPLPPDETPPAFIPPVVPTELPPVDKVPAGPKGKGRKEKPPRVKKEKPPKAKKEKTPKAKKPKKKEKADLPGFAPTTFIAPGEEMPPAFVPSPTGMPPEEEVPPVFEEAPAATEGPAGFDEGEGVMERVRPENVTPGDFVPSPEHQEIVGEPGREALAPEGDTGEAAPVEQISEVTVTSGEKAEVPKEGWQVEDAPETLEKPVPPPPAPPPFEGPAKAGPTVEDVAGDVPGEEDYGAKVDRAESPEQPPGTQVGTEEELHSFFFEDGIDKKGKDQKGDEEPFWE